MACRTVSELVKNVVTSYVELETRKLENIWITFQLVILECIRKNGNNTYVLPHTNKTLLEKEGVIRTEVVFYEDFRDDLLNNITILNQTAITKFYPVSTRNNRKCVPYPSVT